MGSDEEHPLAVVYRRIQLWLSVIGLLYLSIFALQYSGHTVYEATSFAFGSPQWIFFLGVVTGFAMMFFASLRLKRPKVRTMRLFLLILFSILMLATVVLLTGGFIDSPFSGIIALYLGFFFALIQAGTHRKSSLALVCATIFSVALPYVYLYATHHKSLQIVKWHDSVAVTAARLIITIALLILTGWISGTIATKLITLSGDRKS